MKSLEQIRNEVREKVMAENLANQSSGERKKLVDALAIVPQKKMLDDAQYLLNDLLPRIKSNKGETSHEHKFFRGLVDTIMWALFIQSRYENLLTKYQQVQFLSVMYRQKMDLAETELQKYMTTEDLIRADVLNDYRNTILSKGEEWIKSLT